MKKNYEDRIIEEVEWTENRIAEEEPVIIEGYYLNGGLYFDTSDIPTNEDIWC